jgi:hypothetical protein
MTKDDLETIRARVHPSAGVSCSLGATDSARLLAALDAERREHGLTRLALDVALERIRILESSFQRTARRARALPVLRKGMRRSAVRLPGERLAPGAVRPRGPSAPASMSAASFQRRPAAFGAASPGVGP